MLTILIVEDDPTTAFIQTALLEKLGLSVSVVTRGNEAINAMKSQRPDVVVLDIILPGRLGTEILADMAKDPELKDLPIVASTANADEHDLVFQTFRDKYMQFRQEEPLVVNKIPKQREIRIELPEAIATLLQKRNIPLPPALTLWIQRK